MASKHVNAGSEIGITIATWAHSWVCWKKNNMYFLPLFERDNVEWSEEQEAAAQKKVQENSQPLPADKQGEIYLSYSIVLSCPYYPCPSVMP